MKQTSKQKSSSLSNKHDLQKYQQSNHQSKTINMHTPIQQNIFLNKKIVSPQKLKILVLSGNDLQNQQLQFLAKCINLIKLDLSHNHLTKIYPKFNLGRIKNLRVLMLQFNRFNQADSIQAVLDLKNLQLINYVGNPIEQILKIEHLIINSLVNLKIINNRVIFVQERSSSLIISRKPEYIETIFNQWQPTEHSQKYYLKVLSQQMTYIDNMWMYHNPIVKIQRIWRALLQQMHMNQKNNRLQFDIDSVTNKTIQLSSYKHGHLPSQITKELHPSKKVLIQTFYKWKQHYLTLKSIKTQLRHTSYNIDPHSIGQNLDHKNGHIIMENKQYLTFNIYDYYLAKRNLKIKTQLQLFVNRIRHKLYIRKMAQLFARNIRLKILSFSNPDSSYYCLSGLKETKRIYFSRIQQHLIQNFLAHIAKNYNDKHKQIYENGKFGIANQYVSIRLMDPDTYSTKRVHANNTFGYMLWPSMRCVILKKKKFPYKLRSSIIKIKSLTYIKNFNKLLTPAQRMKSNQTYNRLNKFFQNQYYESLGYFECPDGFVFSQLIRMIFYHNTKALQFQKIIERSEMMSLLQNYNENVAVYTQKLLQRTCAAVKIQQQWRRFITTRRQKQSIFEKLKKNRAARLIQRFIRDRRFYHRLSFQKNLEMQLKQLDEVDLVIPQELYEQLPSIIAAKKNVELYENLSVKLDQGFQISHSDFNQKEVFFPKLRLRHFNNANFSNQRSQQFSMVHDTDIYKLLHKQSNVKIIECRGQKFYQFLYSRVEQAKIRAACIALLTYKMYGGQYIFPVSKTTLHLYNDRIKVYNQYGLNIKPFKKQLSQDEYIDQLKINVVNQILAQKICPFLFIEPAYESLFKKGKAYQIKAIDIEFYQKKYQDFPLKYENQMFILSHSEQKPSFPQIAIQQHQLEFAQKFVPIKQPQKRSDHQNMLSKRHLNQTTVNIINSSNPFYSQRQKKQTKSNSFSKIEFDFSKTSEKRLSLYAMDVPPIPYRDELNRSKIQSDLQRSTLQDQQFKKQKVLKYLQSQKQKKLFFKQKKQADLTLIRQRRRQQKMMNTTLKSLHQSQKTQQLRKKTQAIKQFKERSTSKKRQQLDFTQQGNFIMEQQLKMNIMRNKYRETERLRQRRRSQAQTNPASQTKTEPKSVRSTSSRDRDRRVFEAEELEARKGLQPSASLERNSQEVFGGQTEIVNKRSYIKKRSGKNGAYLRDPSFVHGVFPEQYYPIESLKGGIVFPRV